jgi:hypothetical protein
MATTKDKLTLAAAMSRHTSATVRQCEALMRYAGTLWRLERDHTPQSIIKRVSIRGKVTKLCREIDTGDSWRNGPREDWHKHECVAEFSERLVIRTPKGEGIVVPS